MTPAPPDQRQFQRLLLHILVGPVVVPLLLVGVLLWQVASLRGAMAWVEHTDLVITQAQVVQRLLIDMETGTRGYLLTADRQFLEPYYTGDASLEAELDELQLLVSDNPAQAAHLRLVRDNIAVWRGTASDLLVSYPPRDPQQTLAQSRQGKQQMDALRSQLGTFIHTEMGLRSERLRMAQQISQQVSLIALGMALLSGLGLAALIMRQIRTLSQTYTQALAATQQAHQTAQEALRVREVFLLTAAHELRTPLTALFGNAQLLARRFVQTGESDRFQRIVRTILVQSERLSRLIDTLLDSARLASGRLDLELRLVDLGELVRQMAELAQPTLDGHRLELSLPAEPLIVHGDPLRLEQVLSNLLQNAIKYSVTGSTIHLVVARRGEWCCLAMTDQGIGIPPEAQAQIFARFYRGSNINPEQISGMGIGLFLAREIVELHGGRITVQSAEGEGSTFTVMLPLRPS
jgi:signal transduction histidine kinase